MFAVTIADGAIAVATATSATGCSCMHIRLRSLILVAQFHICTTFHAVRHGEEVNTVLAVVTRTLSIPC